jgi:hypothetical protein
VFDFLKKEQPPMQLPPVPDWKPTIRQPLDKIVERLSYYTDSKRDFAVFEHGTCVVLPYGLSEEQAITTAKVVLSKILHYHPDMNPTNMDDGNVLVQYNHPAVNIVLNEVVAEHWI